MKRKGKTPLAVKLCRPMNMLVVYYDQSNCQLINILRRN